MSNSTSFLASSINSISSSPLANKSSSRSLTNFPGTFPSNGPELKRDWSESSVATQGSSASCPSKLPLPAQEAAVIEDLLYILMGIEGNYISFKSDPFPLTNLEGEHSLELLHITSTDFYSINTGFDASLVDLIKRVLPLATCFNIVDAFCFTYSGFKYGYVNHALCSAMKTLLKEYTLLILQLEQEFRNSPLFSLQSFWCHLLKSFPVMKRCAEECIIIHTMTKHYTSATSTRAPSMMDMANLQQTKSFTESNGSSQSIYLTHAQKGNSSIETLTQDTTTSSPWYYKGGGLLGLLSQHYLATSGDPETKKLYSYLIHTATQPYLHLLRKWIHLGKLDDPYYEFMIEEKDISKTGLAEDFNDKYWEQRYKLRKNAIPPFLAPFAEKILLTGKYLNVYLECGESVTPKTTSIANKDHQDPTTSSSSVLSELATLVDGTGNYITEIELAYKVSNRHLLGYLMNQQQLLERLKSIKHFFLLDQSDFMDHFLDSAMEELKKPWHQVSLPKIQSLLDIAIRNPASVSFKDPFKEDLKVGIDESSLFDQLLGILNVNVPISKSDTQDTHASYKVYNGVQALVLRYQVSFPLSLVFSKRAVVKYQMLFRSLMLVKYNLRQLTTTWIHQTQLSLPSNESVFNRLLHRMASRFAQLRMKMMALIQSLGAYLSNDVIEPHHQTLEQRIKDAQTVDDVLTYLHDFLATCIKETFMSNSKLLRIYARLLDLISRYLGHFDLFTTLLEMTDHPSFTDRLNSLDQGFAKLEDSWTYHMRLFIDALKASASTHSLQFLVLMHRLNYNHYYAGEQKDVIGSP